MPTVRHLLPILRLLGMLMLYMSASMLLPVLVALVMHDGMEWVYLKSAALTASIGALLWFGARKASNAAVRKAEEVSSEKMSKLMPAGMPGMPAGMKFPF